MKILWENGHEKVYEFGKTLRGIRHEHRRPSEIQVHLTEILKSEMPDAEKLKYFYSHLKFAVEPLNGKITVIT